MGVGVVATRRTDAAPVVETPLCLPFVFARPSGPAAINLGSAVGGVGSGFGTMCISQSRSTGAITGNARSRVYGEPRTACGSGLHLPDSHPVCCFRGRPAIAWSFMQYLPCAAMVGPKIYFGNVTFDLHPCARPDGLYQHVGENRVRDAVEEGHDSVRH